MLNKIKLNLLGKERVFRFDMFTMELLYDNDEIKFPGRFAFVAKMLYAGLSSGCNARDMENDFSREDILDMVDELSTTDEGREKMGLISDCLLQSQAYKAIIEKENEFKELSDEEKKILLNGIASAPLPLEN